MKLKRNKFIKIIFIPLAFTIAISCLIYLFEIGWYNLDYRTLDVFFKKASSDKELFHLSDHIVQIFITDQTHRKLKTNKLSRLFFAKLNNTIAQFSPNATIYDIIFSQTETLKNDSIFERSIQNLPVYFPIGFRLSHTGEAINPKYISELKSLRLPFLGNPFESGKGMPYFATNYISPRKEFLKYSYNSGHISIINDSDGILRHQPLIIKVGNYYFPTITLSVYLDYLGVSFEKIEIFWGDKIVIPSLKESYNSSDIELPIDCTGSIYIPYTSFWKEYTLKSFEAERFLELSQKDEYKDDLLNLLEGSFIFISDISTGSTDLGETPIESNVPLIVLHTSLLNAFLKNHYFSSWSYYSISILIFILGSLNILTILTKKNLIIYLFPLVILLLLTLFTYYEFMELTLFPLFTVAVSFTIISTSSIITTHYFVNREKRFIRKAFSKFVAPQVVSRLVEDETLLKLHGEVREISVLFSDIANFTNLSEKIRIELLVKILNDYFSTMSKVALEEFGIVDKFIGDAILCEFGAPNHLENHADHAVMAGLKMIRELDKLNFRWQEEGVPKISCRIGINTGKAIVGNMGSDDVFNYTAIGDVVNVAARTEKVNKVYNTNLIITENSFIQLTNAKFKTRLLDKTLLRGKSDYTILYEVYGFKDDKISDNDQKYYIAYEKGMNLYMSNRAKQAVPYFNKALKYRPHDIPSNLILQKISPFRKM